MSDGDFENSRDLTKAPEVVQIQIMTCIDAKIGRLCCCRRFRKPRPNTVRLVTSECLSVGLSIEFHAFRPDRPRGSPGIGFRIHEKADARAEITYFCDDRFQAPPIFVEIPPMI